MSTHGERKKMFEICCVCVRVREWIIPPCGFYVMYNNNSITWVYTECMYLYIYVSLCLGSQMEIIIMNKYLCECV